MHAAGLAEGLYRPSMGKFNGTAWKQPLFVSGQLTPSFQEANRQGALIDAVIWRNEKQGHFKRKRKGQILNLRIGRSIPSPSAVADARTSDFYSVETPAY